MSEYATGVANTPLHAQNTRAGNTQSEHIGRHLGALPAEGLLALRQGLTITDRLAQHGDNATAARIWQFWRDIYPETEPDEDRDLAAFLNYAQHFELIAAINGPGEPRYRVLAVARTVFDPPLHDETGGECLPIDGARPDPANGRSNGHRPGEPEPNGNSSGEPHLPPLRPAPLRLSDADRQSLIDGSKISPNIVDQRGAVTVTRVLDFLTYGFDASQWRGSGILFPLHTPAGDLTYIYRPHRTVGKMKYVLPRYSAMRLDCPPACRELLRDPNVPLIIVEGLKKADSIVSNAPRESVCVIAVTGTWSFGHKPAPGLPIYRDWEAITLTGRRTLIWYDSDAAVKPGVAQARTAITAFVQSRGASPAWIVISHPKDGPKIGADDFFAQGHTWQDALTRHIEAPGDDVLITADADDIGNGERFAFLYHDRARYVADQRQWLVYDPTIGIWDGRDETAIDRLAKEAVRTTQRVVAKLPDAHPKRDKLIKAVATLGNTRRIDGMLGRAKSELPVLSTELDTDPWSLACANGVLDLRTGELYPFDPALLITMRAPVPYDADAKSEEWTEFISLLTNRDDTLATYLQRVAGYCLTGSAREGSLFFLLGETRTGKTTYLRALTGTMGGYAWKASFDSFLSGRRPGTVRDDIAAMQGKRLVIASEVSHGQRFDEAIVKELTGEDEINARSLYKAGINFKPVLKLVLAANDFPHVRSDDSGTWARLNLIKCENTALQDRKYLALKQHVMDVQRTGPAILAWAVRGCLDWQRDDDLARPASITNAVSEKREEFNPIAQFIEDVCSRHPDGKIRGSDLRAAYVSWCRHQGETAQVGPKRFSQELLAMGFTQVNSGGRHWVGLGFNGNGMGLTDRYGR